MTTQDISLTIDGIQTLICCTGDETSSEAVLLLHGNPGAIEDWQEFLPAIGEFSRALAPDMPAYGRADRPKNFPYTVEGYSEFLGKIIDRLGLKKLHLVLHDFGGPWGLDWACKHPDRVASITLVNIGIAPGYRWHKFARIWRTPILGELFQLLATRAILKKSLNDENPKPFPESFFDRLMKYADWGQKRAVLKLYRATSDFEGLVQQVRQNLGPRNIPANVIWGEDDPYVPSRFAEAQREVFDVKGMHIMPRCGHWPMIDEPEAFQALLLPFLQEQTELSTKN